MPGSANSQRRVGSSLHSPGDLVRELVGCQHELVEQFRQKAEQEPQLPFGAEECVSVSTEAAQSATDAALCELVSARSR